MFYALVFFIFIAGVLVGGMLFADSKPRSLLSIQQCNNCLSSAELAGLLASVVVQKTPAFIPDIITETDKTIVFKHPRPSYKVHYMFVPKKDIKNIGELSDEDREYLIDLFSTVVSIINKLQIKDYRLWTNGPGIQDVAYLHFHLGAEKLSGEKT